MTDIPVVLTVITLLEGMVYAPWVKVILLFGVVPVVLAHCWRAVARHVMHPDSRALAHMLLMGFTQVDRQLKHATRYTPGVERWRRRLEPYVSLVVYGGITAIMGGLGVILLYAVFAYVLRAWWAPNEGSWSLFMVGYLCSCACMVLTRLSLVATTRAWQRIHVGPQQASR